MHVLTSLASCLSSLGESLPSVLDAYCQYSTAVVMYDVHEAETRVHIPAHGGSEAQNGSPDSILSHEPKPLMKHRPPPPKISAISGTTLAGSTQVSLIIPYPNLAKSARRFFSIYGADKLIIYPPTSARTLGRSFLQSTGSDMYRYGGSSSSRGDGNAAEQHHKGEWRLSRCAWIWVGHSYDGRNG
ncbi:hypothetical protein Tco_0759995 [Tanacetum coccineum]